MGPKLKSPKKKSSPRKAALDHQNSILTYLKPNKRKTMEGCSVASRAKKVKVEEEDDGETGADVSKYFSPSKSTHGKDFRSLPSPRKFFRYSRLSLKRRSNSGNLVMHSRALDSNSEAVGSHDTSATDSKKERPLKHDSVIHVDLTDEVADSSQCADSGDGKQYSDQTDTYKSEMKQSNLVCIDAQSNISGGSSAVVTKELSKDELVLPHELLQERAVGTSPSWKLSATPSKSSSIIDESSLDSVNDEDLLRSVTKQTDEYRVPYYLENFNLILNTVLKDDYFIDLFNEEDLSVIQRFRSLTG